MANQLPSEEFDNTLRKSWSAEELQQQTRNFMAIVYGRPTEQASFQEKLQWYERYGLLTDFVAQLWKQEP